MSSLNSSLLADDALFISFFVVGPLGLLINLFLLAIILKKKEIRGKEYSSFIINRCLLDTAFCFNTFTLEPLGLKYWLTDPTWCQVAGGISISISISIFCSEPILALNRYISICHSNFLYHRLYQKRNIYVMCVSLWLLGALLVLPKGLENLIGRVPGLFCIINFDGTWLILVIDYPLFCISYGITFFCYYKVYRFLKRHQNQTLSLGQQSRLQENRSILKYIRVSAALPVITEMPMATVGFIKLINKALIPDLALFAGSVVFMSAPVINPILTLFMISPIRKEFFRVMKRLVNADQTPTPVVNLQVSALN